MQGSYFCITYLPPLTHDTCCMVTLVDTRLRLGRSWRRCDMIALALALALAVALALRRSQCHLLLLFGGNEVFLFCPDFSLSPSIRSLLALLVFMLISCAAYSYFCYWLLSDNRFWSCLYLYLHDSPMPSRSLSASLHPSPSLAVSLLSPPTSSRLTFISPSIGLSSMRLGVIW